MLLSGGVTLDPWALLPDGALESGSNPSSPSILGEDPSLARLGATIQMEKVVGGTIFAIAVITCIIFLFKHITKLAAAGDNAKARQEAISGIVVSGLALAVLGSFGAFLMYFWTFI